LLTWDDLSIIVPVAAGSTMILRVIARNLFRTFPKQKPEACHRIRAVYQRWILRNREYTAKQRTVEWR
jgi:hypothetical protein